MVERVVEEARQPCRPSRERQQVEIVGGLRQAGLGQLERLVRRAERQGVVRAEAGLVHQVVEPSGPVRVAGEGHVVAAAGRPQRRERGLVHAASLAPEQAALDRLAGQLVTEAEHVGLALDQQTAVDRHPQPGDQVVLGRAGDRGEHVEGHPPPEHRGRVDHLAHGDVEIVELGPHQLGHRPRQGWLVVTAGHLTGGRGQLLQEERVAPGAGVQDVDGAERRLLVVDGVQEVADLGRAQPVEPDVGDRVPPLDAGQGLGRWMPARQPVGPVGADEQGRAPGRPGLREPLEHRHALGVRPVQVLEHHQGRRAPAQQANEVDAGTHTLVGRPVGIAHERDRLVDGIAARRPIVTPVAGLRPLLPRGQGGGHRIEQQLQRSAHRAGIGLARQHEGALRCPAHQLLHQAGLADARLPGDERHRRRRPGAQQPGQAVELDRPPDHDGRQTGSPDEHGRERTAAGPVGGATDRRRDDAGDHHAARVRRGHRRIPAGRT